MTAAKKPTKKATKRTDAKTSNRFDGPYENVFLNVGTKSDRTAHTRAVSTNLLTFPELETLYEQDGFARRIIDLPAEEMVRAGFELEGIDNASDILAELEGLKVLPTMADALRWAELYGGSLVVMLINDGGDFLTPLEIEKAKEIEQLRVYDRWQVARQQKYDDPTDKRFGKTKTYLISPATGAPYEVHESRCLTFDGVTVPERIRDRNDGWGNSKLQQCYDQLMRMGMSHYWANAILERAQQGIHGIPRLTDLLRSSEGEKLVRKRVDLVDMARSINNTVVIDAEETYDLKSTPFSGIPDILDRLGLALTAVTGIPESLLFGRQQGGLNSTGDADLENWYAKIAQRQNTSLLPNLDIIVQIQLHVMGRFKDDYLIKFNPLSVPSDKDIAETDYKKAQTREIYLNAGVLDPSECRKILDNEGGYEIEDVDALPDTGADPEDVQINGQPQAKPQDKLQQS